MIRARHDRRRFLTGSLAVVALIAGGGLVAARLTDGAPASLLDDARHLTAAGQQMMRKVMIAVLGDQLPAAVEAREAALLRAIAELDATIGTLPDFTRKELGDLFTILSFAPTRLALSGRWRGWEGADTAEVTALMEALRDSRVALRRFAYVTLRDLSVLSFYAAPAAWPAMGYPGPMVAEAMDLD